MLAAVTALDVALVSSIAAVTAAVLTPLVTWIITGMRNRHERWVRVYDDRRDAYFNILQEGYRATDALRTFTDALEQNDPTLAFELPALDAEHQHAHQARIGLFAPPSVARELGEFEDARRDALMRILRVDYTSEQERAAIVADLRPIADDLDARMERVRTVLHEDIAQA